MIRFRSTPRAIQACVLLAAGLGLSGASRAQDGALPSPGQAEPSPAVSPKVGVPAPGSQSTVAGSAEDQVQFADGLFARGLYDLALREYMNALRDHPGYASMDQILYRIGECYREQNNLPAAALFYRRVLSEHPAGSARPRAEFRLAESLASAEKWADALAAFEALAAGDPPPEIRAAAGYHIGHCLQQLGRTADAGAAFRAVLDLTTPSDYAPLAALELAAARRRAGQDDDEQARYYILALARPLSPDLAAEARFQQAELAFRRGRFGDADTAYAALRKEHAGHPRARDARLPAAWAACRNGRFADALTEAEAALADSPAELAPDWLYLKANALRQLLRPADAVAVYEELARAHPRHSLAAASAYERALMAFQERRFDEVIALLREVSDEQAAAAGMGPDRLWLLAESAAGAGQRDLAVQYYRRLADGADSERGPDAAYRLARLLEEAGDVAGAADRYRKLAAQFPRHEAAAQALSAAAAGFARSDRLPEAVAEWARLIREYPDSPLAEEAWFQKGLAEIRLERAAVARDTLRGLLKKYPKGRWASDARLWLAVLLEKSDEFALAETELRAALKSGPAPELERQIRFRLAAVLQRLNRLDESADLLQALLATPMRAEMTPALLEWLARRRLDQGQSDPAAAAAEALIESAAKDPVRLGTGHFLLGRARLAQNRRPDAAAAFARAAEGAAAQPESIAALIALGDLAREDAQPDTALERYQSAAERAGAPGLDRFKAEALRGLGLAHELKKDDDAAVRFFLAVAILYDDPDLTPECLWRAAAGCERMNQTERRDQHLAELKERYPKSEWAARPLSAP
ncbi:MAG: tetratricopeptide repeat protein [Kiritimatiellae bacterium]|nr:tetratricopeptide repeat protein [Kiritimatiellia bacterium]